MNDLPNFPGLTPEYDYEESIVYEGLKTTDTIHKDRVAVVSIPRRQFNLKFGILSSTDMDTLWVFYIQQSGQFKPFIFTSPRDSQQYIARFVNKAMSRTLFVYLLEAVGLNLIEVIGEEGGLC